MTTITVELDEAQAARLETLAAKWQADVKDVLIAGVEMLTQGEGEPSLTPEQEAAIRAGLADIEAGRLIDNTDVMREARRIVEE